MTVPAKPNFLVIGAARSGTTLLHAYLLQHPEIYLPRSKQPEPHFFLKSDLYEKGEEWYHKTYFSDVKQELAIGEISTSYLFGEQVPDRIYNYNPEMKFIVLLRNPVDRAFSNYWHSKKNGFEDLEFWEAIHQEKQRTAVLEGELKEIAPFSYLGRSLYASQLKGYLRKFNRDQFCPVLFEEFVSDPGTSLTHICKFLGVNSTYHFTIIDEDMNRSMPLGTKLEERIRDRMNNQLQDELTALEDLFNLNLERWNM